MKKPSGVLIFKSLLGVVLFTIKDLVQFGYFKNKTRIHSCHGNIDGSILISYNYFICFQEGGILADKRRLTVAITRAKRKLIIIGNASVLKKYPVFEELINLIPESNIIDVLSI